MVVLRAIGRFFARIGRWIKETAWIQPLLIVGGIFAIIFSIPYLTKWVKSWFNEESEAVKYFSGKKLSLKKAEDHKSEADEIFDLLDSYYREDADKVKEGKKKFGDKFFLVLVQEECSACDNSYDGFKTLEKEWGKGSFSSLSGETFKLHSIFVDTKNDDGDNLFEKVYERPEMMTFIEETRSYMAGVATTKGHPYVNNIGDSSTYVTNLENLEDREQISTPTTFLIDLTDSEEGWWRSQHGVREVLFSSDVTAGNDSYAKAKTLRDAWGNQSYSTNIYSPNYQA